MTAAGRVAVAAAAGLLGSGCGGVHETSTAAPRARTGPGTRSVVRVACDYVQPRPLAVALNHHPAPKLDKTPGENCSAQVGHGNGRVMVTVGITSSRPGLGRDFQIKRPGLQAVTFRGGIRGAIMIWQPAAVQANMTMSGAATLASGPFVVRVVVYDLHLGDSYHHRVGPSLAGRALQLAAAVARRLPAKAYRG